MASPPVLALPAKQKLKDPVLLEQPCCMLRQPVGSATNANVPFNIVGETLFPCLATLSAVPFFWL